MQAGFGSEAAARRDFEAVAAGWRVIAAASAPAARAAAEVQVFNQMVVALWGRVGARDGSSAQAGLTELRLLAEGIAADGRFPVAAGWRVDMSVTGYRAGDRIAMSEAVFSRLAGVVLDRLAR